MLPIENRVPLGRNPSSHASLQLTPSAWHEPRMSSKLPGLIFRELSRLPIVVLLGWMATHALQSQVVVTGGHLYTLKEAKQSRSPVSGLMLFEPFRIHGVDVRAHQHCHCQVVTKSGSLVAYTGNSSALRQADCRIP